MSSQMFVDMQFRISVQLLGLQMANTDINISREMTESQYDSCYVNWGIKCAHILDNVYV